MSGNMRCKLFLLSCVLTMTATPIAFSEEDNLQRLVSPELLEHANLKILWENKLPINQNEILERLVILNERIYVYTNHNYMISLDRAKGNMIFGNTIAPEGFPIVGLDLYNGRLISLIGNSLVEIDPETGERLRTKQLDLGIVCPVAHNSTHLYLAGVDKRLRVLRAEDMVRVFDVAADNDSMITSILADENFAIFTTDGGNMVSFTPDKPNRLWQFDAAGGIIGPIVRDGSSLFFACKDANVYRVDMTGLLKANLVWKYQTNAMLDNPPYVTEDVVYQRANNKGLIAIDKKNGKLLWHLAEDSDLLAEANEKAYVITKIKTLAVMDSNKGKMMYLANFTQAEAKEKAYVMTKTKTLAVMDNKTGKMMYSANFAKADRHTTNTIDSKIYIANKDGRIACVTPIK